MSSSVSVIVRSFDSGRTIGACLQSVRAQTADVEIVVIDSGSRDDTLTIARRYCDRLLETPRGAYISARALNLGAEAADGDIVVALSSHCRFSRSDWVERAAAFYEDPRVGAVAGAAHGPHGDALREPRFQRETTPPIPGDQTKSAFARQALIDPAYIGWGFSNHASSWRRSVWAEHHFAEEAGKVEDKEWSWRIIDAGWTIVFDPLLWVEQSHRWRAGALDFFRRERGEHRDLARAIDVPPYRLADAVKEWWRTPEDDHERIFHLLNYRRVAGLAGKYAGRRK